MDVGEKWAYRSSRQGRFHPVVILSIGTKARIEFEEDSYEGERRWVPRSRLEVPWDEVAAHQELEDQWRSVAADEVDDAEYLAAEVVFWKVITERIAELRTDGFKGVADVGDIQSLATFLGSSPAALEAAPAFQDRDGWHIPWSTTLAVARMAAARFPEPLYAHLEALRNRYRSPLVLGEDSRNLITGQEYRRSPEQVRAMYERHDAPVVSVLEAWIGVERVAERADLEGLRRELTRVAGIADRAITALQARSKREGQAFRDELEDQLRPFDFEMRLNDRERQAALGEVRDYFWRSQATT
jgi:hypothetical protein